MNNSPWIAQLPSRGDYLIEQDHMNTDVCIIGAGISGIMTAYHTLLYTEKNILVLDAHKIAHGATGHNAGQIAPYFEKPFDQIVKEYGSQMAHDAQQAIWDAWDILQEIEMYADIKTPIQRFVGYAGCSTDHQIEEHLVKKQCREQTHNDFDAIFIADDHPRFVEWQSRFSGLCDGMSREEIKVRLNTCSDEFSGLLACKKGVTNSALLCEELVGWMKAIYEDRCMFYEYAPVHTIELVDDTVTLHITANTHHPAIRVEAQHVVLCTNGFHNFTIINRDKDDIDTSFHHTVSGLVGYMSAYLDTPGQTPTAISYFMQENILESAIDNPNYAYFYLTRRPYRYVDKDYTLLSLGGPEKGLESIDEYDRHAHVPERTYLQNERFLKTYYKDYLQNNDKRFRWHGLMGFTKTGIRMIGPDPRNSRLMYNLGCNGVGILSGIYGGRKIGKILAGENFDPSVFDVR